MIWRGLFVLRDMKQHKLKTIKEITEVVNEKNLKGFLTDFEAWLRIGIEMKENKIIKFGTDVFIWNDDGDWGKIKEIHLRIELKE